MRATLLNTIARTFGYVPLKRGALDSNAGGRRWRDDRSGGAPNLWVQTGRATTARRGEQFVSNNAHGAKIVEVQQANIVGSGIVPRSLHPDESMRTILNARWTAYEDAADQQGLGDIYAVQGNVVRDLEQNPIRLKRTPLF